MYDDTDDNGDNEEEKEEDEEALQALVWHLSMEPMKNKLRDELILGWTSQVTKVVHVHHCACWMFKRV